MRDPTDWTPDPTVGAFTIMRTAGPDDGLTAEDFARGIRQLIDKANHLVDLMDDAERNHGSLVGAKTLRGVNELRLELSKWK